MVDRTPRQRDKGAQYLYLSQDEILSRALRAEWLQSIAMHGSRMASANSDAASSHHQST